MGIVLDDLDGKIWFDGKLIDWKDAQIHVLTHGLHYASCVFEGDRCYNGKIFKLHEHSERLIQSGKIMGFTVPYTADELDAACNAVCEANGLTNAYVRPVAWRGSKALGISARENPVHVAIAAWEWPSYFTLEQKMKGLRLKTSSWKRPQPDTAPTQAKASGLYMICTLTKHEMEDAGYDDALMLDYRGYVAESTGSNIFLCMDDGKIHTPTPDCFLNGITRQTVIKIAEDLGYEVVVRHIKPEEFAHTKEVFITGTAIEVAPVASIDDYTFTPGEVSRSIMQAYEKLTGKQS